MAFSYAYDRTDELVSVTTDDNGTQSFAYDSRGNLTGDAETGAAVTSYAYDLGNRLTGIDASGTASDAVYAYDALGRIAARTVGAPPDAIPATDTYSYAGASSEAVRIATAQQGQGAVNLDSAVGPSGDRLAAASGSTYNWFLPDLHGSVAGSLSADQSTVTSATRYDAWGDTIATGAAGGTPVGNTAWKYQGRLDISPSGLGTPLYAMGARLYSPGVGAFTSLDAVAGSAQSPLSMNRFLYAAADPATLVDPTGHTAILEDEQGTTLVRLGSGVSPTKLKPGRRRVDTAIASLLAPVREKEYRFRTRTAARTGYLSDQIQDAQTAGARAGDLSRRAARAERALAAAQGKDAQADAEYQGCHTVRCQMAAQCYSSPPNPGKDCGVYSWSQDTGLDRPAQDATPNLLVPLVMFGAPVAVALAAPCIAACSTAALLRILGFATAAEPEAQQELESTGLSFSETQLQSQLQQHGPDWGMTGGNTAAARQDFMSTLVDHVDSLGTTRIDGLYRGNPARFYVDPEYGLNVVTSPEGGFMAGWRLGPEQIWNTIVRGRLN